MFSRFFIDRPIFATVLSVVVALAGGLALLNLPVSQYPKISPPAVTVSISYPGASAQTVADTVAAPIEQQVNGVPGMLYLSSQSGNDGSYTLTVTFDIGTDLNTALVVVQNRVQLALPVLPTAVQLQGITIRKRTPDILSIISLTSDGRYDTLYLSNFATTSLRDEVLRLDGVSDVTVFGQRDYSMRAWLDPPKLAARGLTALDVRTALAAQNLAAAAGRIGQPPGGLTRGFQFPLDTLGRLTEPEQFGDIVIRAGTGTLPPALDPDAAGGGGTGLPGAPAGGGIAGTGTPGANAARAIVSATSVTDSANTSSSTGGSSASGGTASSGGTTTTSGTQSGGATTTGPATAGSGGATTTMPTIVNSDVSGGGGGTAAATATTAPTAGGTVGADGLTGGALDGGGTVSAAVVRLRDVARIELGAQSYSSGASFDGKPSVGLAVRLLPDANALDVADRVNAKMAELKARFPDGVDYNTAYDTTPFIRESVQDVVWTLFEAVGLVAVVVLLFLQSWRAALIPLLAVPVAVLGTFAVMLALGFTVNTISLFGLVLAIGIVVDDAIVVVENVERWLDEGHSPKEAAYKAMEEVTGPVVAIALVLSAVFVPCAFVGGISGQFYRQFAVTIAASTVLSALNSLTLSPALAALLLKPRHRGERRSRLDRVGGLFLYPLALFGRLFNRTFELGTGVYAWLIGWLLRLSLLVLLVYGGLLALTYAVFMRAPLGFVPEQDQGRLIVSLQLPDSASLQRTQEVLAQVDAITRKVPGVAHTTSSAGTSFVAGGNSSNYGSLFVVLDPFDQRQAPGRSGNAIMAKLRRAFAEQVRDADVKVFGSPAIPGLGVAGGWKVMIEDRGGLGLVELERRTDDLVAKMNADPTLVGAVNQFRSKTPQLYLDVDRTKVQALGVNLNDVNQTLQIYLGSLYATNFTLLDRTWQVTIQAEGEYRAKPDTLNRLQVRSATGQMIPLSTLVKLREVTGPVAVNRYNLYPAAGISGNVRPDVSSGDAIAAIDRLAADSLPRAMTREWTELFYLQIRTGNTAVVVFGLAVVFVFLALAALYESWALPMAVILVVPLCLLCSVGGVLLAGRSVDIFVQIGLIVLVGLACKNAILIVEFAEVLHRGGKPRREAALEASRLRLRPILMTSLAFILGVLPLVLASGAGAEMRRSLGIAVFSGMLGVTAFGIFLTPVFFDRIQWAVDHLKGTSRAGRFVWRLALGGLGGAAVGYLVGEMRGHHPRAAVALGALAGALGVVGLRSAWERVRSGFNGRGRA